MDLQAAGCFAVVFEAIPTEVTDMVMQHMDIVVIGIGAGPSTDGQVLVLHDLLGVHDGHVAKFVRQFADVRAEMLRGRRARTRRPSGPGSSRPPSTATRSRRRSSSACRRGRPRRDAPAYDW